MNNTTNTKLFFATTIISVAVLTGCTPATNTTTTTTSTANTTATVQPQVDTVTPTTSNTPEIKTEETPQPGPGAYIDYNAEAVVQAATTGDAVLFFYAPWCPTCTVLNKDLVANASSIPAGVTIFKTDYDTNLELRRKYGVTYQHTLVQVDAAGNMITKWSGGYTLDDVLSNIQ